MDEHTPMSSTGSQYNILYYSMAASNSLLTGILSREL